MICKANLQLLYVCDIERSSQFYKKLFQAEPVFVSPRYVAFAASSDGEALFAIWSGGDLPDENVERFSEVGVLVQSNQDVDALFVSWVGIDGVKVMREPYNEVFGRTFLITDPDGHVVRVSSRD